MSNNISIKFISREKQGSEYDWANISVAEDMVGKARCKINGNTLTIFSINIFPEFKGNGYGREFVENAKLSFDCIIADRVRQTARGFWEKVGFIDNNDGTWIYRKIDR